MRLGRESRDSSEGDAKQTKTAKCNSCCDVDYTIAINHKQTYFDTPDGEEAIIEVDSNSILIHRTVGILREAAAAGCPTCAVFIEAMSFFNPALPRTHKSRGIGLRIANQRGSVELQAKPSLQLYTGAHALRFETLVGQED